MIGLERVPPFAPLLDRLTWWRCDRCGEPIDPANIVSVRPWEPGRGTDWEAVPKHYHPGGAGGCIAAVKDLARRDLDAAVARASARIAAAYGEPV